MIKQQLTDGLQRVVSNLGFSATDIVISISQNPQFGDYSTNIPLQLANQKSENGSHSPQEIAKQIVEALGNPPYLERVDIAGPSFINFFIKPNVWRREIKGIDEEFGDNQNGDGKKILLEHTSVNPNKAMHIGHLRNAVLGDSLARILRKNGYLVETQNYIDDTGVQVADTYVGIKFIDQLNFKSDFKPGTDDYYWDLYAAVNRKYEENPDFLKHRVDILKQTENPDSQVAQEVKKLAEDIASQIQQELAGFQIYHNLLVRESDILSFGFWEQAFEILKETPGFEKETEGKNKDTWLVRFGAGGDDEHSQDKIFVRSDGTTTYTAKDFAYNLWKFGLLGRDFKYRWFGTGASQGRKTYITDSEGEEMAGFGKGDLVYTVIDERQSYLQQVLIEVFRRLGYQDQAQHFKHIAYGVVNLSAETAQAIGLMLKDARKSYAMSGRKGIGVKVADLQSLLVQRIHQEKMEKLQPKDRKVQPVSVSRIAQAAIKYYMLKVSSATEIVFDLNQALNLYGATGPYLQYTHARVWGILEKLKGLDVDEKETDYLPSTIEISLIKKLLEWPDLIGEVAKTLDPSSIATYAFELAQFFNTFYEKHPVVMASSAEKPFRINLVRKFQIVFKNVLESLGIEAPERM